ncbi:MAG: Transcription elongation factor GreA [Parcubacteria group bacterium GW2011_GWC2_49_9]|nr:MAG: Transcription elongation factor GreA [Parcubacteria group bacterium GW2011_GWC2_49_9]
MRVPIRKPGKYTHDQPDLHLTRDKLNELTNELERLRTEIRPRAMKEVSRLAEMGDFSENAAYQIAKGRLRGMNERILDLEERIGKVILIEPKNNTRVQIGHRVTVEANGKQHTYLILGSTESNPDESVISHTSPLGAALIGKGVGDTITVKLKEREVEYKIVKVG